MSSWHVTGVGATIHEHLSLPGLQQLNDDVRLVPRPVSIYGVREGKQHGLPTRQDLRAVGQLAFLHPNENFWFAAVGGNTHDAGATLAEDNPVRVQLIPKGLSTGYNVTAVPLSTLIFLSVRSADDQKTMNRLSGEKMG